MALPTALLVAACGTDEVYDRPDADSSPDVDAAPATCAPAFTPSATLSTYPGEVTGETVGAGADLRVDQGVCADQVGFYDQVGDDVVVELTGLEPGSLYRLALTAEADLGLYVVTDCADAAIDDGECLLFDDRDARGELSAFTAPAGGTAYVVVDSANLGTPPPTVGAFTLQVDVADCTTDDDCGADAPLCVAFECVQCVASTDCTDPAAPLCDVATNRSVASFDECVGDDPGDDPPGDDGPAAARPLAAPGAPDAPTVATGAVCGSPAAERDWYTVDRPAGRFAVNLAWPPHRRRRGPRRHRPGPRRHGRGIRRTGGHGAGAVRVRGHRARRVPPRGPAVRYGEHGGGALPAHPPARRLPRRVRLPVHRRAGLHRGHLAVRRRAGDLRRRRRRGRRPRRRWSGAGPRDRRADRRGRAHRGDGGGLQRAGRGERLVHGHPAGGQLRAGPAMDADGGGRRGGRRPLGPHRGVPRRHDEAGRGPGLRAGDLRGRPVPGARPAGADRRRDRAPLPARPPRRGVRGRLRLHGRRAGVPGGPHLRRRALGVRRRRPRGLRRLRRRPERRPRPVRRRRCRRDAVRRDLRHAAGGVRLVPGHRRRRPRRRAGAGVERRRRRRSRRVR